MELSKKTEQKAKKIRANEKLLKTATPQTMGKALFSLTLFYGRRYFAK